MILAINNFMANSILYFYVHSKYTTQTACVPHGYLRAKPIKVCNYCYYIMFVCDVWYCMLYKTSLKLWWWWELYAWAREQSKVVSCCFNSSPAQTLDSNVNITYCVYVMKWMMIASYRDSLNNTQSCSSAHMSRIHHVNFILSAFVCTNGIDLRVWQKHVHAISDAFLTHHIQLRIGVIESSQILSSLYRIYMYSTMHIFACLLC